MRVFLVSLLFVTGCGLSQYREERDTLLRELRDTPIGPYHTDLGESVAPPPASDELEATMTAGGVTARKAVSYALTRNPELVSALSHWEMLLERVPQRSSFDDPNLFYEEYLQPTETRAGPKERKVVLSQRIPWPGKLGLKGEMALEDARRAEQEYRSRILKVIEEVEHAYADLALNYQLIEINEDLKRIMKNFEQIARRKLEAGRASQPDVLRAQIQYIHLEHHGIVLERDRKIALEKLNAVLNRPPRALVGSTSGIAEPEFEGEIENLIALAERSSPRLRGAEHAIAGAMARRSAASLDYYPDFSVGARYEQIEGGTNPAFSDDGDDIFTVSLGLNLPLQMARRSAAVREADAALRKAKGEYQRIKREISRDVVIAFERLLELRHEAHLLKGTLLPQSTQHLGSAQKVYQTGELDFLSLLDAEKNIESIRRDYARVAADFQKAKATLKRAVGGTLK